ncbi:hypothetical protein CAPTEDRAFT_144044, partial [Capitella teleta]
WFHGCISREEAEDRLTPKEDGLFLVRERPQKQGLPGDYALSICHNNAFKHCIIKYRGDRVTIDGCVCLANLRILIQVSCSSLHS